MVSYWELTLLAVAIGYCIDLVIGDPLWLPHPICLIGRLIASSEKFLRKFTKDTPISLKIAGGLLVLFIVFVSFAVPFTLLHLAKKLGTVYWFILQTIFCWQALATKCLKNESMKVYQSLKENDIEKSRYNVSMIVGRDTNKLDETGIIKATVETVAENTCDGVVAPIIYCALGGGPLGFAYKAINTMDSMIAYKNQRYIHFGFFAAKLDDIANFIPARISAFVMIFSAYIGGFNGQNAFIIWKRDRYNHKSPNSAQTESVAAGALEIQLAGDAVYDGIVCKKPFIGDSLKDITSEDIKRVNKLMYITSFLSLIISVAFVYFVKGGLICL